MAFIEQNSSKLFDMIVRLLKVRFISYANTKSNLGLFPVADSRHEMVEWTDRKRTFRCGT